MTEIIGLLAETYIHPGSGQSAGAIDLPVARERTTQYPFIPGSSMKGALLDAARDKIADREILFGAQENAGALLISDARLLLLPVRSLSGAYRWLTCPYLLERFRRDLERAGKAAAGAMIETAPQAGQVLTGGSGGLFLEERLFKISGATGNGIASHLEMLIAHEETRKRLAGQLAIVCDDDFAWFAQYALPVQARNALHTGTKASKALWYEEALPPDTLMYFIIGERNPGTAGTLGTFLSERKYIQLGGNETVGQGWMAVRAVNGDGPS